MPGSSGYGYGDGFGSGFGYGDGFGSGFGYGDGFGDGYGYGDGFGDGFGYGDGEATTTAGKYVVAIHRPYGVISAGCQAGTLSWWRERWEEIARDEGVSMDEARTALQAVEAAMGGAT